MCKMRAKKQLELDLCVLHGAWTPCCVENEWMNGMEWNERRNKRLMPALIKRYSDLIKTITASLIHCCNGSVAASGDCYWLLHHFHFIFTCPFHWLFAYFLFFYVFRLLFLSFSFVNDHHDFHVTQTRPPRATCSVRCLGLLFRKYLCGQ